ncbi:putative uncharacterized protein [Prevotella sp. CAG:255]|uniref:RecQ family ATP-dependent DNA helicase n=1 Tax=Prevotella sp. CAG:255 TaxID=1262923 RepID=UPI000340547D|nr:ATP-dependent DNA helicase RecQ [Prevotella sp. CAG:255]CCX69350.1 putative uncharacterized protein [Prevotella sp. CAG:255]
MVTADDKYRKILRDNWGYDDFRGIQREIIDSICAGRDTLGLMPTGGGKSITFQVPALSMKGVCIVITPLIALMKDQVVNLRHKGIKAAAVYSGMMHADIITTLENAIFGGVKILYVSPERLSSELFQKKMSHMNVSFITVDEAHCISQWGYDFRPSYLKISDIRKLKPDAPILALTATATPKVVNDIQDKLGFKEKNVFKMSFERKNLAYIVRKADDKFEEMLHILNSVSGSAIVYVRSRKRSKEIAAELCKRKISATYYNAGLESAARDERQKEWHEGKARVMVATNAFGMGIDKPDVRLVIHHDCPDSPEAYFQEAGRAGRDGKKAYAVLLYNGSDKGKLRRRIEETFPDKDYIRLVYEHLAYFYQIGMGSGQGCRFEFNIDRFCVAFKHFPIQAGSALKILSRAGYIDYDEESDNKAQIRMLLGRNELNMLDSLNERENAVITALLRCYGGLFSDFCYIDESLVAQQAGLTVPETYMILKDMTARRILHFIPRKKIPHITYTQRREEMERLVLSKEIYDNRKKEYMERIEAMINYATNDDICRSRQLLRYFGEERSTDCNQCDVCIAHKKHRENKNEQKRAEELITELLSDKKPHCITEIKSINFNRDAIEYAVEYMLNEEKIYLSDGMVVLRKG